MAQGRLANVENFDAKTLGPLKTRKNKVDPADVTKLLEGFVKRFMESEPEVAKTCIW